MRAATEAAKALVEQEDLQVTEMLQKRFGNHSYTPAERIKKMAQFIAAYQQTGIINRGLRASGLSRTTVKNWEIKYPVFGRLVKEAHEYAVDEWEEEARRRAVDGVDHPVIYKGEITTTYKDYSDRLMEVMLAGHRPQFRRGGGQLELTGPGGGPIQVQAVDRRIIDARLVSAEREDD